VPLNDLRALVLKEIMDNALDAAPGKSPTFGIEDGFYCIEDAGPGIEGGAETIKNLFSIRRPLTSTKVLRKPSRGALGNGIRVIVGSVMASGGEMIVETQGSWFELKFNEDGTTSIASMTGSNVCGTKISIKFGSSLPASRDDWHWARLAAKLNFAQTYSGKSSALWYDSDSFYELLQAAGGMSLKELLMMFEGFERRYNAVLLALNYSPTKACTDLSREGADRLLGYLQENSKEISPKKIGRLMESKEQATSGDGQTGYSKKEGFLSLRPGRGEHSARLPFVVEAFAVPNDKEQDVIIALVNGTPITGDMTIERRESGVVVYGCGLRHIFKHVSRRPFTVTLNITIPYMPITTDGKAPDFGKFISETLEVMRGATRQAEVPCAKETGKQTDILDRYIDKALEKASGSASTGSRCVSCTTRCARTCWRRHEKRLPGLRLLQPLGRPVRERERRDQGHVPRSSRHPLPPPHRRDDPHRHHRRGGVQAARSGPSTRSCTSRRRACSRC
jgi:hypothetical protein